MEKLPRGALLSGPPGTGKTLFASAFASCLGFRLIAATVGAWQAGGHIDDTLNAMRSSFHDANDGRGAVLFIDELGSIRTRPTRPSGHHNDQYWQIVINEFLSLMNNLGDGVIVVGATNNPEWIDPAILRAGRIDNHFALTLPDASARAEILQYHAEGTFSLEALAEIAGELEGTSAAAIEALVRDARKDARDESANWRYGIFEPDFRKSGTTRLSRSFDWVSTKRDTRLYRWRWVTPRAPLSKSRIRSTPVRVLFAAGRHRTIKI